MAFIVKDRVMESSTTTGTGNITLAGAYTGFRAFSAVCSTGDTVYYLIEAVNSSGVPTGDWETGLGTYSAANTLTRTTLKDSSTGSAVSFAAGTKRVSISPTAAHLGLLNVVNLISSQTVSGSSAATVSFTSIPGSYNDLILVMRTRGSAAAAAVNVHLRLNGDSGANYDYQVLTGNTSANSTQAVGQTSMRLGVASAASAVNSNRFGILEARFIQYTNTNFEKDVIADSFDNDLHTASTSMRRIASGGTWRNTAAVTQIDILMDSGNIDVGSTFFLYGRT